jgi:hypothetical protein
VLRRSAPVLAVLAAPGLAAQTPAPLLRGYVTETWGNAGANRCVPDVDEALEGLADRGDLQGVQRLAVEDGRWLALSRSGAPVAFALVELESRDPGGFPFGTNRAAGERAPSRTAPPETDRLVLEVPAPEGFRHAGGMQALGHILAVPFEEGDRSIIAFYDVSDPRAPRELHVLDHAALPPPHDPKHASVAGLVRLAGGRILLVTGERSSKVLEFHLSNGSDPGAPGFGFEETVMVRGVVEGGFQNVNLLTQCDGTLFLVGAHNTGLPPPSLGRDWVRWYRLGGTATAPTFEPAGGRRLRCDECNFGAGAGLYIAPDGRLVLYAVSHSDGGPGRSTSLEEFPAALPRAVTTDGGRAP